MRNGFKIKSESMHVLRVCDYAKDKYKSRDVFNACLLFVLQKKNRVCVCCQLKMYANAALSCLHDLHGRGRRALHVLTIANGSNSDVIISVVPRASGFDIGIVLILPSRSALVHEFT